MSTAIDSEEKLPTFSPESIAREIARRLESGDRSEDTIAAAVVALRSMATLYERSSGVLARALDANGRLQQRKNVP